MNECHCFYCVISKQAAELYEIDDATTWVSLYALVQKELKRLGLCKTPTDTDT